MRICNRFSTLLLAILGTSASAQTFVLDPFFGSGGIATYQWPVDNGYQWDAVNAWAVRSSDGKWAVATQLRVGTGQTAAVNWFESNGQITPAAPGAGAYTPFLRSDWNLAGLVASTDGSLTWGASLSVSSTDIDFLLRRSLPDGSPGYAGCNGTFFQQVFFDLAPPLAINDVLGGLTQDFIGRQVMVGTLDAAAGESRLGVARVQPQCGLDSSFNGSGQVVIDPNPYTVFPPPRRARGNAVEHDPFGRVLLGGGVTFGLNNTDDGACIIVRLLSNGQRDGSFGNNGVAYINSFTALPGNIRCDVRGLAVQNDGRIIVNMDWALFNAQAQPVSQGTYVVRLTGNGTYDPSWNDPCCPFGTVNVDYRSGGAALFEADGIALYVFSSLTSQAGVDDSRGEIIPLRLSDGQYAGSFLASGQLPLGFDSASYHRIVVDSPDAFLVVATSGPDLSNHRRVHLLRYRRASTIPADDQIFRNGFDP